MKDVAASFMRTEIEVTIQRAKKNSKARGKSYSQQETEELK